MYQEDTHRIRFHLLKRIVLWTLFIGAVLLLGVKSEHDRLHRAFVEEVDTIARHSVRTAKTFDVALDGFRQFLGLLPAVNLDAARRYAATLRSHYPELQLFAIAQSTDAAGEFADRVRLRQIGYRGLRLVSLTSDRAIMAGTEEHFRLPLIFTEPMPDSGDQLLLLDRQFNRALAAQGAPGGRRLSEPFVYGAAAGEQGSVGDDGKEGKAYLLYAPILDPLAAHGVPGTWPQAYALLLVKMNDLVPAALLQRPGWSLQFSSEPRAEQPGRLLWRHGTPPSPGPNSLLGSFHALRAIGEGAQSLTLQLSYRPGWRDLDHQFLGLLLALVLSLVIVAKRVISFSHRQTLGDFKERSSLYQQAHYDQLTGLPNVNLLMDRLERSMATLDGQRERLVLAYLDLDQFKPVNDRWGHDAGDQVLVEVAQRLRQQFRLHDTVSRIHGDEFIVLLSMPLAHVDIDSVEQKVVAAFDAPFLVEDQPVQLGASLGIAVCPTDARDPETLISVADQRMYQLKGRRAPAA